MGMCATTIYVQQQQQYDTSTRCTYCSLEPLVPGAAYLVYQAGSTCSRARYQQCELLLQRERGLNRNTTCMLDVLTPLSDCRQESFEKMERRISGVSYMCWIDFHNGIWGCGFLCARLISLVSLFRLPRRGLPRPTALSGCLSEGYHAPPLSFPATTPLHMQSS